MQGQRQLFIETLHAAQRDIGIGRRAEQFGNGIIEAAEIPIVILTDREGFCVLPGLMLLGQLLEERRIAYAGNELLIA